MKHIHIIYTLLFGVAVLLFFGLAYPHHLHYQEQYQLFLFDSTYVWDIVRLPGGVADLLGRFCTQFFLYAWVGALIIALLLSAVQLLTLRLLNYQLSIIHYPLLYALSFVPSFLLWLFLLDENALLGGVWAVLLTLLASWLMSWSFGRLVVWSFGGWGKKLLIILFFAAIPILYWIVGPICVVFFLLQVLNPISSASSQSSKFKVQSSIVAFVLLAIMLFILASHIPVQPRSLWFGIHYHRYPTVIPVLLWSAALSVFVLALIARFCNKPATSKSQNLKTLLFCALCFLCGLCAVWKYSNLKAEKVMQYDFMARHQQWNRILATINAEKPNNQIGVTVQNLALGMHGLLADHLFEFNQNGILGLLPDVQSDATSPLPTAEAFYQLGMINVAQRTVFECQEAILDFQKSGRCYKRLAQTNLINGKYEVARKYLTALQKTLFYRDWANETMALLGDEKAIAKHPEYGRLRQFAYKENLVLDRDSSRSANPSEIDGSRLTGEFYFSDHVTPEMLESLYYGNTDNRLAFEYLKAYYMLTGDREGYNKLLRELEVRN